MRHGISNALEFLHLEEELRAFTKGRRFLFVVSPGNWGDALIFAGTMRFLRARGFEFETVPFRFALRTPHDELKQLSGHEEVVFVFMGGGGFLPHYIQARKFPKLVNNCDRVLVMPSTFPLPIKDLGLRETDKVYRRDNLGSINSAPDAAFCHDMAFCLGPLDGGAGHGPGYFFREDSERPKGLTLPAQNVDISKQGKETSPIYGFFQSLAKYETIFTNRLHVAIGGCLLGREVHLFPNSYFKNEAIFHSSLKANFDRVHFQDNSALGDFVTQF